jgi:hypothetical protein
MSYVVAAYGLVVAAVVGYAGWLASHSGRLARELRARSQANRG